jgi:hypothetical protein
MGRPAPRGAAIVLIIAIVLGLMAVVVGDDVAHHYGWAICACGGERSRDDGGRTR